MWVLLYSCPNRFLQTRGCHICKQIQESCAHHSAKETAENLKRAKEGTAGGAVGAAGAEEAPAGPGSGRVLGTFPLAEPSPGPEDDLGFEAVEAAVNDVSLLT